MLQKKLTYLVKLSTISPFLNTMLVVRTIILDQAFQQVLIHLKSANCRMMWTFNST